MWSLLYLAVQQDFKPALCDTDGWTGDLNKQYLKKGITVITSEQQVLTVRYVVCRRVRSLLPSPSLRTALLFLKSVSCISEIVTVCRCSIGVCENLKYPYTFSTLLQMWGGCSSVLRRALQQATDRVAYCIQYVAPPPPRTTRKAPLRYTQTHAYSQRFTYYHIHWKKRKWSGKRWKGLSGWQ